MLCYSTNTHMIIVRAESYIVINVIEVNLFAPVLLFRKVGVREIERNA